MDLSLSDEQEAIHKTVAGILERYSPDRRGRRPAPANQDLLNALNQGGYLDLTENASALESLLVVELGALHVADAPIAARALIGPLMGIGDLPLNVAVTDVALGGIVRYGEDLELLLALDGGEAVVASRDQCEIEPISSRYGYPYARVIIRRSETLPPGSASKLRDGWRLAIAAEVAGASLGAIEHTARYVTERRQFRRPIGSFQAVQHRMATAYVMAEGTRWLARRAAGQGADSYLAASAATYACKTAQLVYTSTHQVTGGIGSTIEHGLVAWTMRLIALQREFGGHRSHSADVALLRRGSPVAVRRSDLAVTR